MRIKPTIGLLLLLTMVVCSGFGQAVGAQFEEKSITVFGQSLHYWDVGSGPVLVLLHGLGSRKEDWRQVVAPLSRDYRVLVPDQVGFGKSDKPPLDYRIQTYVDFLDEFLRRLNVERANVAVE